MLVVALFFIAWKHGGSINAFLRANTEATERTSKAIADLSIASSNSQKNHDMTHESIDNLKLAAMQGFEAARKAIDHTRDAVLESKIGPHIDAAERYLGKK